MLRPGFARTSVVTGRRIDPASRIRENKRCRPLVIRFATLISIATVNRDEVPLPVEGITNPSSVGDNAILEPAESAKGALNDRQGESREQGYSLLDSR